jgi:hypothetical protein
MTVEPPKETFVLEAKWTFNSREERDAYASYIRGVSHPPLTTANSSYFSHCKVCGRPRWMQTLAHGTDECRLAHSAGCRRWEEKGGYSNDC